MSAFEELFPQLAIFPLHAIVNGRCGCGDDDCTDIGKHPAIRWSEIGPGEKVRGFAGHGIATGVRSGIFVVDIDGERGAEAFDKLGSCPATFTVATGRVEGGLQLYFRHPGFPVQGSAGKLGPKIDIRGDGGYVVAPSSPHRSGARYEVLVDVPLSDAPPWLLAWPGLRKPPRRAAPETLTAVPISNVENAYGRARITDAARYLAGAPLSIEGRGGRTTMFAVSCMLVRRLRLPIELAVEIVDAVYNPRLTFAGTSTWSLEEIAERLESARDSGTTPPGDILDEPTFYELNPEASR